MQDYIETKGASLRRLRLDLFVSLDLSIFGSLAASCRKLESLTLNMGWAMTSYGKIKTEPYLKGPPRWPTRLRSIWIDEFCLADERTADKFLQSLVDAAPHLLQPRTFNLDVDLRFSKERHEIWLARSNDIFHRVVSLPSDDSAYRKLLDPHAPVSILLPALDA